MSRLRWPLLIALICAPVALLASRVPLPLLDSPLGRPRPLPVPAGSHELAYLHTTINQTTWERFVAGMLRAPALLPGLTVDASAAFSDTTTAVPEVVIGMAGRSDLLRVRWYKLSSERSTADWVRALAERDPPPLALVGGGSSDRAADLARALAAQGGWKGQKPLLFITTATADELADDRASRPLVDVYAGRTFRFCFTNRQMAAAVTDFVWGRPDLRPGLLAEDGRGAVGGGAVSAGRPAGRPHAFMPVWEDDPFSRDLHQQFRQSIGPRAVQVNHPIAFSVGGFSQPNRHEGRVVDAVLAEAAALEPQRSLLVLPTITVPARRLVKALTEANPQLARRLVAVTGDGIPVNAIYRDGEFVWPVHALPVPLVLFCHHDPLAWDADPDAHEFPLRPPSSTEDVLHFAELVRVATRAAFDAPITPDAVADRLRRGEPPFFDPDGNRLGGRGEYVCVLWPRTEAGNAGVSTLPQAALEVWERQAGGWRRVRTEPIDQRHLKALAAAGPGGRG